MAISKTVELQNGIKVEAAYLRVEFPSISKDKMRFTLRKYVNTDKPFFVEEVIDCSYNIDGDNPFKQAYEYLKTLDEFKGSENC